ncbi:hypothetical protein IF2G_03288 [Cordyceps javanica]|nr:hypothetical protein IF2G_03288 [Cordyceps javanica]
MLFPAHSSRNQHLFLLVLVFAPVARSSEFRGPVFFRLASRAQLETRTPSSTNMDSRPGDPFFSFLPVLLLGLLIVVSAKEHAICTPIDRLPVDPHANNLLLSRNSSLDSRDDLISFPHSAVLDGMLSCVHHASSALASGMAQSTLAIGYTMGQLAHWRSHCC